MITTVFADGKKEYEFIDYLKKRAQSSDKNVIPVVSEILDNVRENGDSAVRDYTVKFDGKAPEQAEISADDIDSLIACCDKDYLETVKKAAANIADFHQRQVQQSWLTTKPNGVIMGQRVRGLKRVGIYVPGGTAAYPSSVLMNAIPAKIAGVQEIVMCTPPQKDGTPNPNIIAAAKLAGVDRIFLMGGAQAVAAMAYGTETVPKVDKIVGPGNIFVATAKKLLYGTVDIDMIAGPSEILIVADKTAADRFGGACRADQGGDRTPVGNARPQGDHRRFSRQLRRDHRVQRYCAGDRLCQRAGARAFGGLLRKSDGVRRQA